MRDGLSQALADYQKLKEAERLAVNSRTAKLDWIIERFRQLPDGAIVRIKGENELYMVKDAVISNNQITYYLVEQWGITERWKPFEVLEVVE
jgi:hypothetical protein